MCSTSGFQLIQEVEHNFSNGFLEKVFLLFPSLFSLVGIDSDAIITVLLCNEKKMAELYFQFQGKKKATDVLSWQHEKIEFSLAEKFPYGEVAICFEVCNLQAKKNSWDFEVEFVRLLMHGLAHLGGYHHTTIEEEEKMLSKEKAMLKLIGLGFVYD